MKNSLILLAVFLFPVCAIAEKSKVRAQRGGLGFLYPDHNRFVNPAAFPHSMGTGIQGLYSRVNASQQQAAELSVVHGGGMWGLGAFGSRSGTNLTASTGSADTAGVAGGFSLAKGKFSTGLGYERQIGLAASNDGLATGAVLFNFSKFRFGVGATSTIKPRIGSETQTVTAGLGYMFSDMYALEANVRLNDVKSTDNSTGSVFFNLNGHAAYLSLGYSFNKDTSDHEAMVRAGFAPADGLDLSVFGSHVVRSGSEPTYGASVRFLF